MLKIFWDRDNIGFIGDRISAEEHSHCVLQAFLSLDKSLQLIVDNKYVGGKLIIVNKNVKHVFSCDSSMALSVLVEPTSSFANELSSLIDGNCLICDGENIELLQQKAALTINSNDKAEYITFINYFAEYLGVERKTNVLDERISMLSELLHDCDCYDHTVEYFAQKTALSPSRLSHLFKEQIGVPLKSYILFHQLEKAFTAILDGKAVTDAAMLAGFDSPSHFAATAKKWMGMPATASLKDSEFLKVFF